MREPLLLMQPVIAGVICGIVGFTSSFAVVLTGLTAMGADSAQASSGLAVLCLAMGVSSILLSWRYRAPVTAAWSTPGAALLATAAAPEGGFATAVGAFILVGILLALSGLVPSFGDLVRQIPTPVANAMLAGVLLSLCLAPFRDLARSPATIAPIVITWLLLLRLARRWSVPGAFAVALIIMGLSGAFTAVSTESLLPQVVWVTPALSLPTMVAVGVPLYIVTMTSQNIPGITVLQSFDYHPPVRGALTCTGALSALGAPLGGHAINLSAIAAALAAGPEAGADRDRRWIAGVSCGVVYILLGPASRAVTEISQAAPAGLLAAVAGLALIASFANAASSAMGDVDHREAAAVTFLVAASGFSVAGIGAAFWSLLAGLIVYLVTHAARRPAPTTPATEDTPAEATGTAEATPAAQTTR
ncbi:benzoate membrane transport protein [Austwickia chelonae]|uniref:Putative BenE family transporter n=1 Tax=Austwickia chelonae NBRC 105200 TaxID=1184607 RepID=K6UP03_9MICO|nr:benzoate/H(+) symporter BenE family transporter [Austwickia chelonae]GAB79401.1 putative BenE family transporter [Austwickia chelonae NBRC 105200]SEW43519.1 benzoate membrane transport protein [Austwickia chelonae]